MSLTFGQQLALAWFCYLFAAFFWLPTSWVLLTVLTPKSLLEKYFKEPHFTFKETIFLAQFPGSLMRTAMFGWMLVWPSRAHKIRKIYDVHLYMPNWYRRALKALIYADIFTLIWIFGGLGVLLVLPESMRG